MWPLANLIRGGDAGPLGAVVTILGFFLGYEGVHRLLSAFEWKERAAIGTALLLLCWPLSRPHAETVAQPSLADAVRSAVRMPSYCLLAASSFLAGATSFMSVHQYAYLADHGLDFKANFASLSGYFFGGLVGIIAVACMQTAAVKNQLAVLSLGRAAAFLCLLLLPLNQVGAVFDFFLLGAFLLPVAPLTTVLTARLMGTRWLATLFGVLFLMYGMGTVLGVYVAGLSYDWAKSYDVMLWLACSMSIAAALACFFIREPAQASVTSHAIEPANA